MKKVNINEQLDLVKEVISNLTPEQLQEIEGGLAESVDCWCLFGSCVNTHAAATSEEA